MKRLTVFFSFLSFLVFWTFPEHLFCEYSQKQGLGELEAASQSRVGPRVEHHIHNLETEMGYMKQKIENQEATIDTLRQEIVNLIKATKELNAKSHTAQDAKIAKLEKNIEKLLTDIKQFKTHANETADALADAQKNIQTQTNLHTQQSEQVQALEAAMKSLVKALQNKDRDKDKGFSTKESSNQVSSLGSSLGRYRVKSGDSLAKIAKELKVSTKELKELNGLQSDKITIGQELQIPQLKSIQ